MAYHSKLQTEVDLRMLTHPASLLKKCMQFPHVLIEYFELSLFNQFLRFKYRHSTFALFDQEFP